MLANMSTIWTPGGERPVRPASSSAQNESSTRPRPGQSGETSTSTTVGGSGGSGGSSQEQAKRPAPDFLNETEGEEFTEQEIAQAREQLEQARAQLLESPVEDVIANHCYGIFELAALYLSSQPAQLPKARVAIDSLGFLVEGLSSRLGPAEKELKDALTQIRLAYVQIETKEKTSSEPKT